MDTDDLTGHACSPALRRTILRRVPFFAHLDEEALDDVDARFHEVPAGPERPALAGGEPAGTLFVVATGDLAWRRDTPQGRAVLLDVLVPGETFGSMPLLGLGDPADTVTARVPSCLLRADAADVRDLLERHPGVAVRVLERVSARLGEAHEAIRHLSASRAAGRVAAVLLRLASKFGSEGGRVLVPLSQQDLADMAGTTLETVNRTLHRFRDEGLVRTGRGRIEVLDPGALRAAAERDEDEPGD